MFCLKKSIYLPLHSRLGQGERSSGWDEPSLHSSDCGCADPSSHPPSLCLVVTSRHDEICNGLSMLNSPEFVCLSEYGTLYHQGLFYSNSTTIFPGFLNACLTIKL